MDVKIIQLFILIILIKGNIGNPSILEGDHICSKIKRIPRIKETLTKTVGKDNSVINNTVATVLYDQIQERFCCDGYFMTMDETRCIPICKNRCHNGDCIAPNECDCYPGYTGPTCNKECGVGLWGPNCQEKCECSNGEICNHIDGKCICNPGYKGDYCEQKCLPEYYGKNCTNQCVCQNGALCNHVTGDCTCSPGYIGETCSETCPPGTFGFNCEEQCKCRIETECNKKNGFCQCSPGWRGGHCKDKCPPGTYGLHCEQKCNCENGADCYHINGTCWCLPGYFGERCQDACPFDKFGIGCNGTCECMNGANCSRFDGSCDCADGYEGNKCESKCRRGYYGRKCSRECACEHSNECDNINGNCFILCSCSDKEYCDPTKGCVCKTNEICETQEEIFLSSSFDVFNVFNVNYSHSTTIIVFGIMLLVILFVALLCWCIWVILCNCLILNKQNPITSQTTDNNTELKELRTHLHKTYLPNANRFTNTSSVYSSDNQYEEICPTLPEAPYDHLNHITSEKSELNYQQFDQKNVSNKLEIMYQ